MTTWYCVKTVWDDYGCMSARIIDSCESDEKPLDDPYCEDDLDLYYTWYAGKEAAERAIEKALAEN